MALSRVHTTSADGTFSSDGAIAWNASHGVTGADVGGIPFCPTATTEATSSGLTFDGTNLVSLFKATGVGTAAAPPFWIPDAAGAAGMWQRSSGFLDFAIRGANYLEIYADGNGNGFVGVASGGAFSFASGAIGTAVDIYLIRAAASVLASSTNGSNTTGSFRGKYQSSDGTAGVASFGPGLPTSMTVKDGIITAIS